jgi:hypothetical protein
VGDGDCERPVGRLASAVPLWPEAEKAIGDNGEPRTAERAA